MAREYEPFIIEVEEQSEEGFRVEARFRGSTWFEYIPSTLPHLKPQEILQASQWLERGFIDRDYAQDFGRRLFQTLFQGSVREGFRIAYERTAAEGSGLRIVLTLPNAPIGSDLGDLLWEQIPWELMYDDEGEHGFLARSVTAPLVRHFKVGARVHEFPGEGLEGPLRVLFVTASPSELPQVSAEEELTEISDSLTKQRINLLETVRLFGQHLRHNRSISDFVQRVRHRNLFQIDVLTHATPQSLQRQMINAKNAGQGYHVVHFAGHGQVDENGAHLIFESEDNGLELVSAERFAEIVDEPTVNLVVLNACQTAYSNNLSNGVAHETMKRGVPAVIGMQVPVLDRSAVEFAQAFYGAWAAGQHMEAALAYARRLIKEESAGAAADWGVPVLFMGPLQGLKPEATATSLPVPPIVRLVRWAAVLFISLLSTVGLLLTIPDVNEQLRTEVPYIRCIYPYPMESGYSFNVVVTEFTVLDEAGSAVRSADGSAVADYLYQQLEFKFDEFRDELRVPYEIRPPGHTCRLKGSSRTERDQAAESLAERINADIVVNGVITDSGQRSQFSPEFFVNYRGFEEAEEIAGRHELGKALRVVLPFEPARVTPADNPALTARTSALSLITIGLSFYSIDDFEEALDYFTQAEETEGWLDNAGKEVVYLLLGNTLNRLASREKSVAYLAAAEKQYTTALTINPTFARAEVGKAGTFYLMALGDPSNSQFDNIDLDKLDEAKSHYETALNLGSPSETADIETKVHFGLGQVYTAHFLHALQTENDWTTPLTAAKGEFQKVVQEYKGGNVRVANRAGHAYARLALLARMQGETETASELYKQAIELVTPYYQSYYNARLGEVYIDVCQIEQAIASYQEAVQIAEFYGNEEQANDHIARLNEISSADFKCNQ